jgi:hypothetical protein
MNNPAGFGETARSAVTRCAERGGWVIVYGHPHALSTGHAQGEKFLVPFLQFVAELRAAGKLNVCLPRDVVNHVG